MPWSKLMSDHRFALGTGVFLLATLDAVLPRCLLMAAVADACTIGCAAARDLNTPLICHEFGWERCGYVV